MKKIVFFLMVAITTSFLPLTLSAQNGMDHGHRYIDLGLPSGTKWADCNIGAKTRTNYGYYYAWGETTRKTKYDWDTYKYVSAYDELTKYCTDSDYGEDGFTDDKEELDLSDDVAHKLWGGKWRIPTKEQFEELIDHTKHRWTKINGVKGMLFTGRNGHSIFLPAAGYRHGTSLIDAGSDGYYWSRTLDADYPRYAFSLDFSSGDVIVDYDDYDDDYRGNGFTVRPVYDKNTPVESSNILKVSGTDNGHRYVDLGLPSGTKWADCNVGASSSSQYGNYYAWGETATKSKYDWDTYKYGYGWNELTKYCTRVDFGKNGFKDNKTELDLSDDVAHTQWGGQWRMPTKEQFDELQKHTTSKWTSINNVWGRLFTAKNGNSIFLPAAGFRYGASLGYAGSDGNYWSRTLNADYPEGAYTLRFYSGDVGVDYYPRYNGFTVRPVRP